MNRPAMVARRLVGTLAALAALSMAVLTAGVTHDVVAGARPAYAAPSRAVIAATANAEVGYVASGGQCQKYGPLCDDWCAMFATWVWERAGVSGAPRTTYVATAIGTWGVNNGLFKTRPAGQRGNPLPGDIAVYGAPGSGAGGHVSVVYSVNADGTITTIDGNYSNRVHRRTIDPVTARAGGRDVLISGYVSPPGVSDVSPPATGRAFHNLRRGDGSWSGAAMFDGNWGISDVASAGMPNGDLHVVTVTGGNAFHNVRLRDGRWLGARLLDGNGAITAVSAAGMPNGDLHVVTLTAGKAFHNLRYAGDGRWSGASVFDANGAITAVATGSNAQGDLHVVTLTAGNAFHNVRYAGDGRWSGATAFDRNGAITDIAAATTDQGNLHVVTLTAGNAFHNVRYAGDGRWSGASVFDPNGAITDIAAAGTRSDGRCR